MVKHVGVVEVLVELFYRCGFVLYVVACHVEVEFVCACGVEQNPAVFKQFLVFEDGFEHLLERELIFDVLMIEAGADQHFVEIQDFVRQLSALVVFQIQYTVERLLRGKAYNLFYALGSLGEC